MLSFKTELKKAAIVIQSHTSGHAGQNGLNLSLLNQKQLEESLNRVADIQVQASTSLMEWASDESDHIRELYVKLADLEVLHSELYQRYVQQIECARQCYKAIAKGEKQLHEFKKEYDLQQTRANKVRKQVESTKKKKEKDKVLEDLEIELATAYSQESKAADDFRNATVNHSKFKLQKIQEALRVTQKASMNFHNDVGELAKTQEKITQLFVGPEREEYVDKAAVLAMSNITSLAEDLGVPKPISISDKQAGASFKSHEVLRTGSWGSTSSTSSGTSRHSMPVYMEQPEREISRPTSSRVDMPLPALPIYPSLPSGNSLDQEENGELYSEQYYSYTDMASAHPSGILMNVTGNPPPCPPRPASSLPGFRKDPVGDKRNSAPAGKPSMDFQGNPLPPLSPDKPGEEYMSLVEEGIYDTAGNLQVNLNQTETNQENDTGDYMSLQGIRPDIAKAKRGNNHTTDTHMYDNRLYETSGKN